MSAPEASVHFRILDDIARDLSGDINFPVCMDAAVLIRDTLKDPFASLERVAQAVGVDPLIASKLLRLANSVSYNPAGKDVVELTTAISRLGFEVVRTLSLAVAMDQMLKSVKLSAYKDIGQQAWGHSLHVAAIARVLARRLKGINPEEAMLAGLVHDIGIFYMLYRATDYPQYRDNRPALLELLIDWHAGIGARLLQRLGLPRRITDAVRDHIELANVESPSSLRDVLYFANLLADDRYEWHREPIGDAESTLQDTDRARYADIIQEANTDILELRAALGA